MSRNFVKKMMKSEIISKLYCIVRNAEVKSKCKLNNDLYSSGEILPDNQTLRLCKAGNSNWNCCFYFKVQVSSLSFRVNMKPVEWWYLTMTKTLVNNVWTERCNSITKYCPYNMKQLSVNSVVSAKYLQWSVSSIQIQQSRATRY